jgi:hypothetical protein
MEQRWPLFWVFSVAVFDGIIYSLSLRWQLVVKVEGNRYRDSMGMIFTR